MTKHRRRALAGIVVAAFTAALWFGYFFGTERGRFERGLARVRDDPSQCIGEQAGVGTLDSLGVSSRYIGDVLDGAYSDYTRAFGRPGRTYFSHFIDMPTQETIWQFPGYFVRLYATSALETDGAEIGVFSGTYEEFRGPLLTSEVDPRAQFTLIEYSSPKRFLYADR